MSNVATPHMPIQRVANATDLARLVDPRSIAIIGASDRPGSLGSRTVANLLEHSDFGGRTYLINPSREQIAGLRCYPGVNALPEAPDVALLVVPAQAILPVLRDCAAKGVRFAVVFSSGFGELGGAGREAEQEMARIARASGMRIYGPNSPGLCNLNKRLGMMFSPAYQVDQKPGAIGLATQGGGIGRCFVQALERGVGVGLWASTGNEVDLSVADFIRYMAEADDITTIATAMEGIKDGKAFIEAALLAAERGKPVIALKVGRSDYGARAVQSHTGSISGTTAVNSAALRQAGVVEVDDIDELIDTAALFARRRPRGSEKVAVYGFSGGACAIAADAVGESGLTMATFAPATLETLRLALPDYAAIDNPVDATSDIITNPQIGYASLKAVADDPDVGVVLYPFPCDYAELTERIAATAVQVQNETETPIVAVWTSDRLGAGWETLIAGGLVPTRCTKKTGTLLRRWIDRGRWGEQHPPDWHPTDYPAPAQGATLTHDEVAAKTRLSRAGIVTPRGRVAHSAEEAAAIAKEIGFPVVAKVVSIDLVHKSDVGGVRVGLVDEAQVRAAHDDILADVGQAAPQARVAGVLVEAMAGRDGIEVLVGVTRDPVFGPILTFGLGGIFVEVFKDVSRRMLPVTPAIARQMVSEPQCARILQGYRGKPAVDLEALERLLVTVSDFVCNSEDIVEELELNPVWVGPAGSGAVALDAVLVTREGACA